MSVPVLWFYRSRNLQTSEAVGLGTSLHCFGFFVFFLFCFFSFPNMNPQENQAITFFSTDVTFSLSHKHYSFKSSACMWWLEKKKKVWPQLLKYSLSWITFSLLWSYDICSFMNGRLEYLFSLLHCPNVLSGSPLKINKSNNGQVLSLLQSGLL